jgi:uncharacterized protein (DUF1330 family)
MNTNYKIALAVLAGATLGAGAMQGLHAQAKLKAYSVSEVQQLDPTRQADDPVKVRAEMEAAHGHSLRTYNGRTVSIQGSPPPQHVAIIEWDSAEDAVAFYKSKTWMAREPERNKVQKTIRRYVVEVEK